MTEPDNYQALRAWCAKILEHDGHNCPHVERARYLPEQATVMCGCGYAAVRPEPAGELEYTARDPIQSALGLIDATKIYTPDEVERHILDVLARLETGALFERECILREERALDAWNRTYWRAIAETSATSEIKRKAAGMVACEEDGTAREKHEAVMLRKAVQATMHNLRAVLSGYQSVAKSVAVAYQGGGAPGQHDRTGRAW